MGDSNDKIQRQCQHFFSWLKGGDDDKIKGSCQPVIVKAVRVGATTRYKDNVYLFLSWLKGWR